MTDSWICRGPILNKIEKSLPTGRNKWTFRFRGRFKINKNGCFIYTGKVDKDGYPSFSYLNKFIRGNQLSWILMNGEIPNGMCVCHTCDDPRCINPAHLFLGTNKENTADRNEKNRQARGQKQAFCKLTQEKVILMREDYFQKGKTLKTISTEFGVCPATAREAIQGINWKWV